MAMWRKHGPAGTGIEQPPCDFLGVLVWTFAVLFRCGGMEEWSWSDRARSIEESLACAVVLLLPA